MHEKCIDDSYEKFSEITLTKEKRLTPFSCMTLISNKLLAVSVNETIKVYDIHMEKCRYELNDPEKNDSWIQEMKLLEDGSLLSGTYHNKLNKWCLKTK